MDAGDDLDQRGLAGAVVAEQADHLAAPEAEVDVLQDAHAAEGLGDVRSSRRDNPEPRDAGAASTGTPVSTRGNVAASAGRPALGARRPAVLAGRWDPALPDLLLHERGDHVDVGLVDEAAARVDEEAAEAVVLGQAELLDGQEALQVLLLVDDQADVAVLDALRPSPPRRRSRPCRCCRRRGWRPSCRSGSSTSGCHGR